MNIYSASTEGKTKWQQYNNNSLYVEIDTSAANFSATPQYFASLGGQSTIWQARGVSSIYYPGAKSFQLYVQYLEGPITPDQANQWGWYVNWMGIESY